MVSSLIHDSIDMNVVVHEVCIYKVCTVIEESAQKYLLDYFISKFDDKDPCTYHIVCPCDRCSSIPILLYI